MAQNARKNAKMDDKQLHSRYDAIGTKPEWLRGQTERRQHRNDPDFSLEPSSAGSAEMSLARYHSPKYTVKEREQLARLQSEHFNSLDGSLLLEQNERMERQLQQSVQLLNQKKHMQQQLLLMQQKQLEQQRQFQQQQQQHNQQLLLQQQRQFRQRSPERREPDMEKNAGRRQQSEDLSPTVHFTESFDNLTVQDLFVQCQKHLNVINACTDLQQTIKDEMKKQAKLDNIICQKLTTKAQRLHQQAVVLEKALAPAWVRPALQELGNQVCQQAEMHQVYTTTLMEQCLVIQHSLDGHHELMKSVLAQTNDRYPALSPQTRNKAVGTIAHVTDNINPGGGEDDLRCMTFLQASNIFEGIRKPRTKLLSSLEYHQEQLNATLSQLSQIQSEIEDISKADENESLMWRIHLQKKDLEVRKEFLETRKEQLESDVQFARMDLNDFEYANKDSMLEVLNVFRQHRVRYDSTLRQSFQLLKAASLRDINVLRKLSKKSDLDLNPDRDAGDANETISSVQRESWTCSKLTTSKMDTAAMPGDTENDAEIEALTMALQNSGSLPLPRNKKAHMTKANTQEQLENKTPTCEMGYPMVLSSDSEISFVNKTDIQRNNLVSPEFKQGKKSAGGSFGANHPQNVVDFNFSRADSSSVSDINDAKQDTDEISNKSLKSPAWNIIKERVKRISTESDKSDDDTGTFIITKHKDNVHANDGSSSSRRGVEDVMIVSRGPRARLTLGNFENSINSNCSVHCLCPVGPGRDVSSNNDDRKVAHLISKYASGNRSKRPSVNENWSSSMPLIWCGIRQGNVRESSTRVQMSRSLIQRDVLAQHNVLTVYNETKHISRCHHLEDYFRGKNKNNSENLTMHNDSESLNNEQSSTEHKNLSQNGCEPSTEQNSCELLTGQNSCELLTGQNSCELLTDQSASQITIGCESLSGHNSNVSTDTSPHSAEHKVGQDVDFCELETDDHGSQNINGCDCVESQVSCQSMNDCESLESQSLSQNMSGCEAMSGHVSRNLNNCEPLKNHAVDAENVQEREDRLEFDVNQVLLPDTHSRNIRVCTVRPIPSDSEDCGVWLTRTKENKNKGSKERVTKSSMFGKYDNLRLYEVTAGQFIVSEQENGPKQSTTTQGTVTNCSNNKQADFLDGHSETCPDKVCLKKTVRFSLSDHKKKSLQDGILERRNEPRVVATEHQADVLCETSSLRMQNKTQPQNVRANCLAPVCKDQHTSEGNLQTVSIDNNVQMSVTFSNTELPSYIVQEQQNVSPAENGKSEILQVLPTVLSEDTLNDRLSEEETLLKTVYEPHQPDPDVGRNHHVQHGTKSSDKAELQTCGASARAHGFSSKEAVFSLADNEACSYLADSEGWAENQQKRAHDTEYMSNATAMMDSGQAFSQSIFDKHCFNQMNITPKENDVSETSEHFTEMVDGQSPRETGECTVNPRPQTQSRPLKSSLKKPTISYSYVADSNHETQESSEQAFQCGLVTFQGQTSNDFCMQRNGDVISRQQMSNETVWNQNKGKVQKCIKQVRFDNRVRYDDNTEIDAVDESTPNDALHSLNTNKNCVYRTQNVLVNIDDMRYSTTSTSSYFANVFAYSSLSESNHFFSEKKVSVICAAPINRYR